MLPINLLAVVLAAVASFVLGFLFHGPVSGKLWMKLAKIEMPKEKPSFKGMIPQMLWNFLTNLVTAYVLAVMYFLTSYTPYLGGVGVFAGVHTAIWLWAGFILTTTAIEVIWMGRSVKLWLFEAGCSLVAMVVMGAIIGSF